MREDGALLDPGLSRIRLSSSGRLTESRLPTPWKAFWKWQTYRRRLVVALLAALLLFEACSRSGENPMRPSQDEGLPPRVTQVTVSSPSSRTLLFQGETLRLPPSRRFPTGAPRIRLPPPRGDQPTPPRPR